MYTYCIVPFAIIPVILKVSRKKFTFNKRTATLQNAWRKKNKQKFRFKRIICINEDATKSVAGVVVVGRPAVHALDGPHIAHAHVVRSHGTLQSTVWCKAQVKTAQLYSHLRIASF